MYGGSLEDRMRFPLEVVRKVRESLGRDYPLGIRINGNDYVDGGVTNNLPVDVARAKGADIIIAVNISKNIRNPQINTLIDVIMQSINIMGRELVIYKSRGYDVLIEPNVGDVGMTDFSQKKKLMDAGIQAAKQAMPRIRKLIEEKS